MAQKGTYTAYQQLKPLEENLGEIARDAADREIEAQARTDAKRKEAEARQKEIATSFQQDYGALSEVITNNRSIDEAFARGVNSARDMTGEIYKRIQKNPSLANDVNVQLKLQNLRNYSKNLKTVSDKYTSYATSITEGMTNGTISSWEDESLNQVDSVFSKANLDVRVDPATGLPIAATTKLDGQGNPVIDEFGNPEIENLNLINVLNGTGINEIIPIYNMAGEAQKIGPDLGKRTIKKPDGSFSHIEYQSFDAIEADVRNLVDGYIGTAENPTSIAKSIWSDTLGNARKELTDEDMKTIEDAYTNTIAAFYDETAKRSTDLGARNTANKNAADAKKDKKGEPVEGTGIQVRTDEKGKPLSSDEVEAFVGEPGGGSSFSLKAPVPVGVKGNQIFVDNLYLTRDGRIVFGADVKEGKSGDYTYTDPNGDEVEISKDVYSEMKDGGLNVSQLNDIARAVGLNNAGELKKELENVRDGYAGGEAPDKKAELRIKYEY